MPYHPQEDILAIRERLERIGRYFVQYRHLQVGANAQAALERLLPILDQLEARLAYCPPADAPPTMEDHVTEGRT